MLWQVGRQWRLSQWLPSRWLPSRWLSRDGDLSVSLKWLPYCFMKIGICVDTLCEAYPGLPDKLRTKILLFLVPVVHASSSYGGAHITDIPLFHQRR